ncbi:hypothetical protein [Streptococcus uberis]|uniref:hypothetical protein n=1 Tax=Streptococcus uberis TaxID=1349 RepID=UPI0006202F36|nr:hypothetical protein [Streptococcus uberis]
MAILIGRHGLTYEQAYRTTLEQFMLYQKAYEVKVEDESYLQAIGAWYSQTVQATTGKGKNVKPKFKKFDEFYDHNKEFEKVFNEELRNEKVNRRNRMLEANRRYNKKGGN